jgi:hypothetical protein
MTATVGFDGYDFPTFIKAHKASSPLCNMASLATTTAWVVVSKPGSQQIGPRDGYAKSNYDDYARRFALCQGYVRQKSGLLHWGMVNEGQSDDDVMLSDPVTGNTFLLGLSYYGAFVSADDVLLPLYDNGTYVVVVQDSTSPLVKAVIHARLHQGSHSKMPRLNDDQSE